MDNQKLKRRVIVAVAAAATVGLVLLVTTGTTNSQTQTYRAPRTADGRPNLNGIWQAINTAHWDLQAHSAHQGPVLSLGAAFSVPAGQSVVDGNDIPYQPWALAKRNENFQNRLTLDPEIKCFLPGVPRATYMPYPFQIVQSRTQVLMAYEFASASRIIYLNAPLETDRVESWMGYSSGRWDADTLVVETVGFNDKTWFDRAGNFHSDALHVIERFTPISRDALEYEVTIEDPNVFTRPWKMRMPLYRRIDKAVQLLEYQCVEFAEEVLYGHLRRQTGK